jgi:hypothetical protein
MGLKRSKMGVTGDSIKNKYGERFVTLLISSVTNRAQLHSPAQRRRNPHWCRRRAGRPTCSPTLPGPAHLVAVRTERAVAVDPPPALPHPRTPPELTQQLESSRNRK